MKGVSRVNEISNIKFIKKRHGWQDVGVDSATTPQEQITLLAYGRGYFVREMRGSYLREYAGSYLFRFLCSIFGTWISGDVMMRRIEVYLNPNVRGVLKVWPTSATAELSTCLVDAQDERLKLIEVCIKYLNNAFK